MATKTAYLFCQANIQLFYYTSSRNILYQSRKFASSHSFGERNESSKKQKFVEVKKYSSQFKTLELSEDSDRETVRRQYINLVKKYHPDTAKEGEQNLDKFHYFKTFSCILLISRQQQHQKIRAMQASEHVYAHNVGKLSAKYETRLAEQER